MMNYNDQLSVGEVITLEKVEEAIDNLYYKADPFRTQAHNWLISFQTTQDAWTLSCLLLSSLKVESRFFGAQTLESKIKKEWNTLHPDIKPKVKDFILQQLYCSEGDSFSTNQAPIVVTRLCVALSIIVLYTINSVWTDALNELITPKISISVIMELLVILPQEVQKAEFLTSNEKNAVTLSLKSKADRVLSVVCDALKLGGNSQDPKVHKTKKLALKCVFSWVQFDISPTILFDSPLVMLIFDIVCLDVDFMVEGLEALEEIVCFEGGKLIEKYPTAFRTIFERSMTVFPNLFVSIKDDEVKSRAFVDYFVRIGECHGKLLLSLQNVSQYLDFLVTLTLHPEREISQLTFALWYELQQLQEEEIVDLTPHYPIFQRLVEVLRTQCKYPERFDVILKEEFEEYRKQAIDALLYIFSIIGGVCFQILGTQLWEDIQIVSNSQNTNGWISIESTLFCISALSEGIEERESEVSEYLQKIFQLLVNLPNPRPTSVSSAYVLLLGNYSSWLGKNENILQVIIGQVIPFLFEPSIKSEAFKSFNSIASSTECARILAPFFDSIFGSVEPSLANLDQQNRCRCVEGLSNIIEFLPIEKAMHYLQKLVTPIINRLDEVLNMWSNKMIANINVVIKTIVAELKVLDGACKSKRDPKEKQSLVQEKQFNPVLVILQAAWNTLHRILEVFPTNLEIIECLSTLYRDSLLSGKEDLFPILIQILSHITMIYRTTSYSGILQTMLTAVIVFFNHKNIIEQVKNTFSEALTVITQHTLTIMQSEEIRSRPDIHKGYFSLVDHYLNDMPLAFPLAQTQPIFELGVTWIGNIYELQAAKSCFLMLSSFSSFSTSQNASLFPIIDNIINQQGESLIHRLFLAIAGKVSRQQIGSIALVFFSLMNSRPNLFRAWTLSLLQVEGFPTKSVNANQKTTFVNDMMKTKNLTKFKEVVHNFAVLCRDLQEFGTATIPL